MMGTKLASMPMPAAYMSEQKWSQSTFKLLTLYLTLPQAAIISLGSLRVFLLLVGMVSSSPLAVAVLLQLQL